MAILLALADAETAQRCYQRFKWSVLAPIAVDRWRASRGTKFGAGSMGRCPTRWQPSLTVRLADSLDAEDGAAAASSIELADRLGGSEAAAPTLARGGRRAAVRAVMENFPPSPRVVPSLLLARGRRRGQNVRVSPVMRVAVPGRLVARRYRLTAPSRVATSAA